MSAPVPTRSFVVLHLLGCSILWASGFLFIKLVGTLHPFLIAASRGILGAAALMAWFAWEGRRIVPRGEERRHWIVLGALNGWVPNILVAYALTQISAAFGAMIQTSSPLMTAFIAHALFADERLTGRRALGLLVGFAGMAILVGPAALPDSATSMAGTLAMIAAAASYAAAEFTPARSGLPTRHDLRSASRWAQRFRRRFSRSPSWARPSSRRLPPTRCRFSRSVYSRRRCRFSSSCG